MSSPTLHIPQTNPLANYQAQAREIDAAITRVLESGVYLSGRETQKFEEEFAAYHGASYAIACSNGTDALCLALEACGISEGDEVITVSYTAVATVAAIELARARPVFVDIDSRRLTLDPNGLEAALTPRTRAIVPVHLYGQPADLDLIAAFCRRHQLRLVEDCAQACGAMFRGRRVGTIGDVGAFSFYPTKNLSALGDAGAVLTSSRHLAEKAKALRQYGWRDSQRRSEMPGRNARMDEVQAAILRAKLPRLDHANAQRQEIGRWYSKNLGDLEEVTLPIEFDYAGSVFHQYVVRLPRRDALASHLHARGIGSAVHYPIPAHRQPAYRSDKPLPKSDRAAEEVLSLPMFPELKTSTIREIAEAIHQFFIR